jgi:DnaA-like protein
MTEIEINREPVKLPAPWSPAQIALLRRLHAEGVPFSEIAPTIGRPYQATISKANRLGLARRKVGKRTALAGPIAALVARHFGLHPGILSTSCKPTHIAHARQIAMWVAVKLGHGVAPTGRYFRRDHTTVIHAVRKIEQCREASDTDLWLTDTLLEAARQNAPEPPPEPALEPEPPPPPKIETPVSDAPIAFYEDAGGNQTRNTRAYLIKQNERFAAAMRAALAGECQS